MYTACIMVGVSISFTNFYAFMACRSAGYRDEGFSDWHASTDDNIKDFALTALCIEYPAASVVQPCFVKSQQYNDICGKGSWTWKDREATYFQFPALHHLMCSMRLPAVPASSLGKFLLTLSSQCQPWNNKRVCICVRMHRPLMTGAP